MVRFIGVPKWTTITMKIEAVWPNPEMKSNKEALTQLGNTLVANFASHFSLLCGRCWREERVSRKPSQQFTDPLARAAAAEHFLTIGWQYERVALCPTCAKLHSHDSNATNVA